ncbi:unnamed protein product [Rotaria socialis]|uniref:Uncharacterized protein n=1 Tax=Rotaria socialis TaxID=392032 RepID=A0A821S579_9BILA|nr:unnamed protein product [Rotaria socialis]CAF3359259.1 unnamed protein product [Rotaria socialis]CAF3364022.1 unnamed protein product [Rotaria socialis]CAF3532428.1 unnamed protein product [Rotaria socialis]CAF4467225.1 unnamed protein product [Rotaria socialis]
MYSSVSILERKKILITRNESLKNDDKIYFNEFFRLIQEYSEHCLPSNQNGMDKIYSSLKSLIFEYNKDKCIKRILDHLFDDAVSNLEKLPNANVDNLCQKINFNKLNRGSADYYYLKEKKISLKEYILILFDWVNDIISYRDSIRSTKDKLELKTILQFQATGALLYHSEIFRSVLSKVYSIVDDYERILYYLDKVSAHQRSLHLILKILEQRKSEYGEIYKNIQWSFIEPIENIVKLNETPSFSFDKIWLACGLEDNEIKIDFKKDYIQDKFDSYDKNSELKTCLRSEIRMIDYLIEQNIHEVHDKDVEIGISKLPCYPCSLYIEQLNNKFKRNFYVGSPTTYGKIYPKWMFRKNEEDTIKNSVTNQLYIFFTNELKLLELKIRKKSGDSDKQETEIDDDAVDYEFMLRDIKKMTEDQ